MEKITSLANKVTGFVERLSNFFTGILDWLFGLHIFYKLMLLIGFLFLLFVFLQIRLFLQMQQEQMLREMRYRGMKINPELTKHQKAIKEGETYNA